ISNLENSRFFLLPASKCRVLCYNRHNIYIWKGRIRMASTTNIYRVEPLRTQEEIEEMKLALKRGNKGLPKRRDLAERDVLLFLVGINTGLRVNDLVRLKVGDVRSQKTFTIREGKTRKKREIYLHMLQQEMQQYTATKHDHDFLYPSQKGTEAISTTQVYRVLTDAANLLGEKTLGLIRCGRPLAIITTSNLKMWRCCRKSFITQHRISRSVISVYARM